MQRQASSAQWHSSGSCCPLLVNWCSSRFSPVHTLPDADIQYKRTYRKIVRSQCTLTYEKTFYYLKRSRSYLSKTQDTIVHRFSKNCIQFQFWSTCETEYVDRIQKPHSEIVRQTSRLSWWFNHKLIWLKHVEVKDMQVYTLYTKG